MNTNYKPIEFIEKMLKASMEDVNTIEAGETLVSISENIKKKRESDFFKMNESRARFMHQDIDLLYQAMHAICLQQNYINSLKKSLAEKEKCILIQQHDNQLKDIDILLLRDYLNMAITDNPNFK